MSRTIAALLAALSFAGLLGAQSCSKESAKPGGVDTGGGGEVAKAPEKPAEKSAGLSEKEAAALLPGIPLEALSPEQRATLVKVAQDEFCYCGCPHTLSGCLREHAKCGHAKKMAALAARLAASGLTQNEITKFLTEYYSGFDKAKRRTLNVKDFGPPRGKEAAPIQIVEYADFTCPHCQLMRPLMEEFIEDHGAEVKLYYKPFPLPGHEKVHAFEAAEAAEWAREKGAFWAMHDALFAHAHDLAPDDLVTYAKQLGTPQDDLKKALADHRLKAKVQSTLDEGHAAGVDGTPTLFFNGRKLSFGLDETMLGFTLDDEVEWQKNGGWAKD
jgi:protein-disulfide isomerase